MNCYRSTLLAALALAGSTSAQDLNPLPLNNGGEGFLILQDPFVGSDPANGDFSGDLFYKVWPASSLQRCAGVATLNGVEWSVADSDWTDDTTLSAYLLVEAFDNGSGELEPDFSDPNGTGVLVPEFVGSLANPTGLPLPPCPPPGFISSYTVRETFVDTATGLPVPLTTLAADGQANWSLSFFFPDGGSVSTPAVNGCGTAGNAAFPWLASTDQFNAIGGENQLDFLGSGNSAYGGIQLGGTPGFIKLVPTDSSELSLLFEEAVLTMRVDVDQEGGTPFIETGLAGLNPAIGIDSSGVPTGTSPQIGIQVNDVAALTGLNVGVAFLNIGTPAIDTTGCVDVPGVLENLGLSLSDPILTLATGLFGIKPFAPGGTDFDGDTIGDDGVYESDLIPVSPSPGLVGAEIKVQAFTANAVTGAAVGTNLARFTFRANP